MLSLNLAPIFRARGIDKPYNFLVKAGFSSHAASNIIDGSTRSFKLDHIERLCKALLCEPNDLLYWKPNAGEKFPDNFPLNKLNMVDNTPDWKNNLATMTLSELREISKKIN